MRYVGIDYHKRYSVLCATDERGQELKQRPVASNGTSRSSASPRRLRAMTTLVKSWIRMEPSCSASIDGARTSILP